MQYVLFLIVNVVHLLLIVLQIAFLLRMVVSLLFAPSEEGTQGQGLLLSMLCGVTEPVILPFRVLFAKAGWFEDAPLDMPFVLAGMLIMLLSIFV